MAKTNATVVDFGPGDVSVAWTAVPALQNSWTNASGYQTAQYSRSESGRVRLRGQIAPGTLTAGTLLFTLPVGFRPAAKESFPVISEVAAGATTSVIVDTDGTVKIGSIAVTTASSISLSGVQFESA